MDPRGFAFAAAAFVSWGLLPLYWRLLHGVPPLTVLAHRIVWTSVAATFVLAQRGALGELVALARNRRSALFGVLTTALIATNWFMFIWGIHAGRTIECSLGYFLSPLVNVVLGLGILRERISRPQALAVAFAGAGVVWLAAAYGSVPWLGLTLAGTFGVYGLVRKIAKFPSLAGLAFESLALAPIALFLLGDVPSDARTAGTGALLVTSGIVTALPLVWFNEAAQRLPLTVLGLLQYLSPTLQFLVGVLVFREAFSSEKLIAFACIWCGLALYTGDALRAWRYPKVPSTQS